MTSVTLRSRPGLFHWSSLAGAAILSAILLPPIRVATAQNQSEAELRLSVERARLAQQELEDDLAVEERLANAGLASDVELQRARSRVEKARIDTEMARAALTDALPPARLLSATRRRSSSGQPKVRLEFERTGRAAERLGQSVVVSVLNDGLVVGKPFQALLEFPAHGSAKESVEFDLLRDVDQITVRTVSGSRQDEVLVPLEIDAQGTAVRLTSLNSSQDGQLGDSVDFNVVVERSNLDVSSIALEIEGLPNGFSGQILDQEKRSRLRLVQFPQGVNRVPVVVRIDVPEQEDASWSDRVIDLSVEAGLPSANKPLASVALHLRPVGRPDLSLVSDTLSVEVAPNEEAAITVEVVNSGRAAAFDVQPRLSEPIGLEVEVVPKKISKIPAGERAKLTVHARARPEAVEGDYQVRVSAVTEQAGGFAESKDLTLRITVHRRLPWVLLGLGLLGLGAVSWGGWWLRRRTKGT